MDNVTPAYPGQPPSADPEPGDRAGGADRDQDVRTWGVHPAALLGCALAALGGAGWALLTSSAEDRLVAWALVVFAGFAAVGCLLMRRRLTIEPRRLVVRGPGGMRAYPWSTVTGIEVVRRSRLGVASTTVEIDLSDDGLIVLGRFDLGADPAEVAPVLRASWLAGRD